MNDRYGYGRLSSLHKPSSYTRIHIDSSSITLHCASLLWMSRAVWSREKAATQMSLLWKAITGHVSSFACCSQTPLFYLFSSVCVCTCFCVGTWIWSSGVNIQCLFRSLHIFFETVLPLKLEFTHWLDYLASKPQGPWCVPPHLTFYMGVGEKNSIPHAYRVSISPTPFQIFF